MSKNIIIQQDGQAQSLNNVPKISTTTLEGGSCTWVPEDEADTYARTQTLRVDENGTYTPEEGYAGFSEVTVDVEPTLTTRHITENGTYRASDEQADGYSLVSVAVPSASHLGSKMISENGTFRATDDELDGYDVVYVNVTSISGEDYSVDVGEDQVDIVVTDEDTEYNYGVDPETDIASMIVTDPDDGEKYIVSVEPDGTVTRKLFPTKMVITTPPTKTTYTEGETMNYTGIVVTLYDKAGNVFTDDMYTTGVIPFAELEFPVTVAPEGSGSSDEWTDGAGVTAGRYSTGTVIERVGGWGNFYVGDYIGECIGGQFAGMTIKLGETLQLGGGHFLFATQYGGECYLRLDSKNNSDGVLANNIYVDDIPIINGSFGIVYKTKWLKGSNDNNRYIFPESTVDPTTVDPANLHHVSTPSIPVLWRAPTSHFPVTMTFRETFEIEVTNNE